MTDEPKVPDRIQGGLIAMCEEATSRGLSGEASFIEDVLDELASLAAALRAERLRTAHADSQTALARMAEASAVNESNDLLGRLREERERSETLAEATEEVLEWLDGCGLDSDDSKMRERLRAAMFATASEGKEGT